MMAMDRSNRCRGRTFFAALTTLLLVPGCASQTPPAKVTDIKQQYLSFVRDGSTTREHALLQLGLPSAQFEGERIMTWRLCYNGETLFPIAAERAPDDPRYTMWRVPAYNLVLVFDARNLVQRHSFIEVR
jgi:hypothetical protein